MKTYGYFIVIGDIESPKEHCIGVKWYQDSPGGTNIKRTHVTRFF